MNEQTVFAEALERTDPRDRAAFLDQACQGDPVLRARMERLLAQHQHAGAFLEGPPREPTIDEPGTERPGTVIGPYKLIEPIGEGGMGTVWLAQQTEPVKRLVALKFIKAGMDSKQVIARFEAERQALALMDHANIARVLDGGTTKGEPGGVSPGRPYFVMDLVKGVPITRYCDEHHLTPRQRLELFIPVCQAVQHAHQKGIIHRDLKPSNVLVALYDGKPVPKVIDFGVAKAAGQPLTEKTLVTGFGAIVGTLEYMSPEQAGINQLDIDTRSDIYSLGVLLYELLTGSPPFTHKELERAGMLEMLRVIREQEPSKPSTKLSSSDALPTLSANRGTEPAKLTKLVRGELDWIVMKALEKDRNRRYETANGFAMDVQRYLADEAVQACPPSMGYRLRKFIRRNKGPVLAASLVLVALMAGIAGTSWGMVWALRERDDKARALVAETKAREAEQKARERADDGFAHAQEAVELFFNRVTDDPMLKEMDFSDLRKKLLKAAVPFYEWLKEQQQDSDKSRAAVGHAYERLAFVRSETGEAEAAMEDYRHMQAIFAHLAADFPTRPEFRQYLARSHLNLGILFQTTGRLRDAESAYDAALAIGKQLAADFPTRPEFGEELARKHHSLGVLLHDTGRLPDAESAYDAALAIYKQLAADFPARPEFRRELAQSHNNLGNLFQTTGRLRDAESAYGAALAIGKQLAAAFPTRPEFRQSLARSHHNLGGLLQTTGRLPDAESAYGAALAIGKQLAAAFPTRPEFRHGLATSHHNLGGLLRDTGRLPEAESAYGAALAIQKQLAADFPTRPKFRQELAKSHNSLGVLLSDTGRPADAESAYGAALAIGKQLAADFPTRPEFRQYLARSHHNLGVLLSDTGRLPEAESAYGAALAIRKKLAAEFPTRPEFRRELAVSHNSLGTLLRATGRLADAESAFGAALAIQKQLAADFSTRPEFRRELAQSHNNLGLLLHDTGRLPDAESAYAAALAIQKQLAADFPTRPEFRQELAKSHNNLGTLLRATGRPAEAESAYGAALAIQKQLAADFPNQPDLRNGLAGTFVNLANLSNQRRDFRAAKGYLEEAEAHHQAALKANPRHPTYRQFYRINLRVLVRANASLLDQPAAVRAAERLRDLGWDPPGNAYDAATALSVCISIVKEAAALDDAQRQAAAKFYGDGSMRMLRDAVAAGFKNAAHMEKDKDLDGLRDREDFKKLLAELKAGKEPDIK